MIDISWCKLDLTSTLSDSFLLPRLSRVNKFDLIQNYLSTNNIEFIGNTGFDCNFDNGLCKTWVTNSSRAKFNWRLHQGSTGSIGTGPHNDHTTNSEKGKYVYIETSYPAQHNDTAWLTANGIPNTNGFCMSFWYHMYGPHVGSLNLYVMVGARNCIKYLCRADLGVKYSKYIFQIPEV